MTDTSYPFTTITSHSNYAAPAFSAISHNIQHPHPVPPVEGVHEDEGQISCICGYNDDDGNTVACDICNRWQHIICYYPQYEHNFPDDLQHWCVDCRPRQIDKPSAQQRQRDSRIQRGLLANGVKRSAPKTAKKKAKDSPAAGYSNGWPLDKSRHDRNSASPRDQPPPAKRPKTSHRSSNSTTGTSTAGRKRNGTISHRRSTSRSPETPQELYSEHFLRCYLDDDWSETHANLHNGIAVSDRLSKWLQEADEDFLEAHGFEKRDVFVRWDGQIEEISHVAQIQIEESHDPTVGPMDLGDMTAQPMWKYLTLGGTVPNGACIGELKGHVGFKDEYFNDPANRWSILRHPEPFVFFHPKLPIYVDARNEGSQLRFVRRSCQPNARMQIMITEGTEYHFCFMALRDLEPGEEVAIMWDSQEGITQAINRRNNNHGNVDGRQLDTIKSWVSTVLANCGPCACNLEPGECMMSRFDRRGQSLHDDETQPLKVPKVRKKKGQLTSPLNTGLAVNSRSGSEARKVDPDDQSDSRSASGSAGRGSASRDITPNTHYSANGSVTNIPELSERERKKLAKEEEMFRRQEEEASGKQNKKKRGSAGPPLNTPSAASSTKQFTFPTVGSSKYADAGTPKQTGLPSSKVAGKRAKSVGAPKAASGPAVKITKRPRPEYADAGTQCDMDEEEAATRPQSPASTKRYISVTQRLLERCALNNAKRKRSCSNNVSPISQKSSPSADADQQMGPAEAHSPSRSSTDREGLPSTTVPTSPVLHKEIEMQDAGSSSSGPSSLPQPDDFRPGSPHVVLDPPTEPPPPPWRADTQQPGSEKPVSPSSRKSVNMHLPMPPPQSNPFSAPAPPLSAGTPSSITGTLAQSPATTGPPSLFSPAVNAAVNPSPARNKKLSLSDYTKRSKAKDKEPEASAKGERESSPASNASGPVVPPLRPTSSEARKMSDGSNAIEEDVKMEDAAGAGSLTAPS